ncbi:MAG: hypothetical protein M1837_001675 [Sclerophora amabilis]|nr:MAG: hypothetical protein M1837_001675 [Sclerophora amabilis]
MTTTSPASDPALPTTTATTATAETEPSTSRPPTQDDSTAQASATSNPEADTNPPSESSPTKQTARQKKLDTVHAHIATLSTQLSDLQTERESLLLNLTDPTPSSASSTVKRHIRLLHSYNEIRDVGSGLLGLIADQRGVRTAEVFDEFGVGGGD